MRQIRTAVGILGASIMRSSASGDVLYPFDELLALVSNYKVGLAGTSEPLTEEDVEAEFCGPLRTMVGTVRARMMVCGGGSMVVFPTQHGPTCDAKEIALKACTNGSVLADSCICDINTDECADFSSAESRQASALLQGAAAAGCPYVGRTTHPSSAPALSGSPTTDTPVDAAGNFGMFFTDGYMATPPASPPSCRRAALHSAISGRQPNLFVFRVSNVFADGADAMMSASVRRRPPFDATDPGVSKAPCARIWNRPPRRLRRYEPGMICSHRAQRFTPSRFRAIRLARQSDEYLGWPARSWYAIEHDGKIGRLIFDTDQR